MRGSVSETGIRKDNTWASLRFVAPHIGEFSEDITAFQPNRTFLSPSLFLSWTYFLYL